MRAPALFVLLQSIRDYFKSQGFWDVITPIAVPHPGMEVHIHPFSLYSEVGQKKVPLYLHTSPEFFMKKLLSEDLRKIFTLNYCFRDEPSSPIHRSQFLMLEWYRAREFYESIMLDCENLFRYCFKSLAEYGFPMEFSLENFHFERATVQEVFQEYLNIDILQYLTIPDLKNLILKDFPDVPIPLKGELEWDDYFFLLFLNKIEPHLAQRDFLLLYEFPYHLSALSTLKKADPRVCERFEVYVRGIELCNCFNELTDLKVQKERFAAQKALKEKLYPYQLPEPEVLYRALEKGLPHSAGVALGVERLLKSLIKDARPFQT